MPFRWVVEPVVAVTGKAFDGSFIVASDTNTNIVFMPLSATKLDPGRSKTYCHSSVFRLPPGINRLADWPNPVALSLVCFRDFSALAVDPRITDILGEEYADDQQPKFIVDHSPVTRNWTQLRKNGLRQELERRQADLTELDDIKPFWMHLDRLARKFGRGSPDPRTAFASFP